MRRFPAAVCAVVVSVAVAGGIGATVHAAGAASRRIDPCDLLSRREIRKIAGWRVPPGVHTPRQSGRRVCSFTEPHLGGMVQIQLWDGGGRAALDRRRAEAEGLAMGRGRSVRVPGARAAFENLPHGLVGFVVNDHVAQVITIGSRVTDRQQRAMAAVVARNLR